MKPHVCIDGCLFVSVHPPVCPSVCLSPSLSLSAQLRLYVSLLVIFPLHTLLLLSLSAADGVPVQKDGEQVRHSLVFRSHSKLLVTFPHNSPPPTCSPRPPPPTKEPHMAPYLDLRQSSILPATTVPSRCQRCAHASSFSRVGLSCRRNFHQTSPPEHDGGVM